MAITQKPFGTTPEGKQVTLYTLTNSTGSSVSVTDYGAILTSILVPDKDGNLADVCLGFDTLDGYLKKHGSMGDVVGRHANRIGGASFDLDGVHYELAKNHGPNNLHSGPDNFALKVWDACCESGVMGDSVVFTCVSPDGESGFPGTMQVKMTYTWTEQDDLILRYEAATDKATLCNMTHHAYFNLAGHDHGTVRDQVIYIDADVFTPVDEGLIPLGTYMPVACTPLDLREGALLGDGIDHWQEWPIMQAAGGYDHNFVLRKGCAMGLAACAHDENSGRTMEVITDQPAIQLYTANTTNLEGGKDGAVYGPFSGFCLETQHCPDSIHHPNFPGTVVLRPGEKYDTTTIYAFRVDD